MASKLDLQLKEIDYFKSPSEFSIFLREVDPIKQYLLKVTFSQLMHRFSI